MPNTPGDKLATVIPLPASAMSRPRTVTRTEATDDIALEIDRRRLRRHLMAALLQHGSDGVRGHCYCGIRPRSMRQHIAQEVAAAVHLHPGHVGKTLALHRSAGQVVGHWRCECEGTYDDSAYGREQHHADALAASITPDEVRLCLESIQTAGRARRAGD